MWLRAMNQIGQRSLQFFMGGSRGKQSDHATKVKIGQKIVKFKKQSSYQTSRSVLYWKINSSVLKYHPLARPSNMNAQKSDPIRSVRSSDRLSDQGLWIQAIQLANSKKILNSHWLDFFINHTVQALIV